MHHSAIERDACAIVEALRKWRHFLIGRHFHTVIVTDQQSVRFMFDQKNRRRIKIEKILRWRLEIAHLASALAFPIVLDLIILLLIDAYCQESLQMLLQLLVSVMMNYCIYKILFVIQGVRRIVFCSRLHHEVSDAALHGVARSCLSAAAGSERR